MKRRTGKSKTCRAVVPNRHAPAFEDKRPTTKFRRDALRKSLPSSRRANHKSKMGLAERVPPKESPENQRTALHPFGTWKSKPCISQREIRQLAQQGISLRPGIERDTLLMPWVIAESVLHEASIFLDAPLPLAWADWLDQRAEHCYAKHRQFRHLVRKENAGRGYLYAFFRHWLTGKLHKANLGLFRQLPRSYCLGAPLPKH